MTRILDDFKFSYAHSKISINKQKTRSQQVQNWEKAKQKKLSGAIN